MSGVFRSLRSSVPASRSRVEKLMERPKFGLGRF
jgi:hypothetical protein